MSAGASLASELQKLYDNFTSSGGSRSEDMLLDHARRVSVPLAVRVLDQMGLGHGTDAPFSLLENACGVGVVAPVLQQLMKPEILEQSGIVCGDFSDQLLELARKRRNGEGWVNTEVAKVDAQKTGFPNGLFSHVATNLAFHVIPDSEAALNETIRILKPGGVLGFTTPHRETGWALEVSEAFKTFPFDAPFEMGVQVTSWGRWDDVNWIRRTLEDKGLLDVKVDVFSFLSHVDDVDSFLSSYGSMIDWVISSRWTEALRKEHPREEVYGLLKDFLEKKYGRRGWDVSWIMNVASGRVPSA